MRFLALSGASLVLLAALVPAPAQALSACSGTWSGAATCSFSCNDVNLYVRGSAQDFAGMPATVTVTAECGVITTSGVFLPLFGASCSATGGATAWCANSGPNLSFPVPLVGLCTVNGNTVGTYACVSAP